jgi:hypothetical protein
MSWTDKFYNFIVDAFRPPFRNAHWIAIAYVILSVVYNPTSHFNRWTLPDTDDYMRLSQVLHWIGGQSWFDLRVPQLYPQHIMTMHWSRLPDIPIAGFVLLMQGINDFFQLGVERPVLAMRAAFFIPCILLFLLMLLVKVIARPLVGRRRAAIACFIAPLCMQLIFQFTPMRVDHHAYIILLAGVAFYALQRVALNIRPWRMAALAGLSVGMAMWNGAEIMPFLIMFCLCLTWIMAIKKGRFYATGVIFGFTLLGATSLILLIARDAATWGAIEYDTFSIFYVILAAFTAAYFLALYLGSRLTQRKVVFIAFAIFASLGALDILLYFFPDFIFGPYAKANPILNVIFFPNIREAVPFTSALVDLQDSFGKAPNQAIGGGIYFFTTRLFVPMVGLGASLWACFSKHPSARAKLLWFIFAAFGVFFFLLTMFWQVRVMTYAQLFMIPPLVALMLRHLKSLPQHYSGRKLFAFECLVVLSFTVLPAMIIPSILAKSRINPDIMFYLGSAGTTPCDDRSRVVTYFRDLQKKDKHASTILAPLDYTPEFIFSTQQNYIAAPYHRDDRGIEDMVDFFRSRGDDVAARTIAKKLDLDYALVCKSAYYQVTMNQVSNVTNVVVNVDSENNTIRPTDKDLAVASLGMRLAYDKIPQWLEKQKIPLEKDFALYKINKAFLNQPTMYKTKPAAKN